MTTLQDSLESGLQQMFFDIAPVIFLVLDSHGRIRRINKFGCNVLGYHEHELIGKSWFKTVIPTEEKETVEMVFDQMTGDSKIDIHENHVLTKDHHKLLIRWRNEVLKDKSGHFLGTLSAGEDVTDIRKHELTIIDNSEKIKNLNEQLEARVKERTKALAETLDQLEAANRDLQLEVMQRKAAEERLKKNQQLYHIMAHHFPNGMIGMIDRDLHYVLVDGSELENLGFKPQDLLGQRIFNDLYPLVSTASEKYLLQAFEGKTTCFEVLILSRPYHVTAVPIPDTDGSIKELLVVIRNIADIKKIESDLRKNLEIEKELNELKSRFVTMASHEFRTPLSTILSSVFLLEKYSGSEFDEKKNKHIERIKHTVHNLTEILNDFLSLGRLEEGKVKVNLEEINVYELIKDVVAEMSEVKKPDQQVIFSHTGGQLAILDKMLFRNIVINLVYNAIKYSPNATAIEVTSELNDEYLYFTIADQGIGIPEEAKSRIFERFYRASNSNGIQGTGLGLHLVKKYSELLHGKVEFESEEGSGSRFSVRLQLIPEQKVSPTSNSNIIMSNEIMK